MHALEIDFDFGGEFLFAANDNFRCDSSTHYGAKTLTYDIENRLIAVSGPTNATFEYDPNGTLAKQVINGVETRFLYNDSELIGELDSNNNILRRYVHGIGVDKPIAWYEGGDYANKRYFVQNYQGSVIGYTDGNGTLLDTYKYTAFGEPKNISNSESWAGARFRYTGQIALPEAKLYHYKARVYDPALGIFLQTDPIGTKDDMNMYAYVGGNPVNKTDPTGEVGISIGIAGEHTIGVGVAGSVAVAVSFPVPFYDPHAKLDIGIVGSVAGKGIFMESAGIEVSGFMGDVQGQRGVTAETTIGVAFGGVSASVPLTQKGLGQAQASPGRTANTRSAEHGTFRARTTTLGFSQGVRATGAVTARDVTAFVKNRTNNSRSGNTNNRQDHSNSNQSRRCMPRKPCN